MNSRGWEERFAWLEQVRMLTTAPVVISSAHPERVFDGWRERGFAAFLAKPFDLDALTALVHALCDPRHGSGEAPPSR